MQGDRGHEAIAVPGRIVARRARRVRLQQHAGRARAVGDRRLAARARRASRPRATPASLPAQTASTNATAALNPGIAARTRLRFAPIVGATVEAATPLTERLAQRARARGITLAGSADPTDHPCAEGLFLDPHRRQRDHGHLCLGRLRSGRQPPAPHPRPAEGAVRRRRRLGRGSARDDAGHRRPTIDQLAAWLARRSTG